MLWFLGKKSGEGLALPYPIKEGGRLAVNYIREINAFYDWLETNRLSVSAISLWHALMHINNKTGWKNEFTVAMSVLEAKTGLKKDAIIRARKTLQKANRISFKSRAGMQSAVYKIIPLDTYGNGASENCVVLNDTKCNTNRNANSTQTATQSITQTASIPKLNETKQKETIKEAELEEPTRIPYQKILTLYHETCISFPKIRAISKEREEHIGARYKQYKCDIEVFRELFLKVEASDFLKGDNDRKWKATLDWMMNETNMAKILEGKYENKPKPEPPKPKEPAFDPYEIKRSWE